ncbi:MAG TPA: SAM-dependent methyltransferase [Mycobacteriales bacterium]|nr:SAM-dependent methyltransferase [Mycobacteriales bacterium]
MQDRRRWQRWRTAMDEALYGADGFYRRSGAPAAHFRTAAHTSPLWAGAIAELAGRVDAALGQPESFCLVDMGSGGGELLAALAGTVPPRWSLVGVDHAARPDGLPERVAWTAEAPAGITGLVIANEWLDVVPVDVVELADDGRLRLVEVTDDGEERLGDSPDATDVDWLRRWWPPADVGDRAEIGRTRDEAWRKLVERSLARGVAVAIDYAADPARDVAGTLTGYRDGRQVAPVPDGTCDITAHVLMESCAAAVGDVDILMTTQREALRDLGVDGRRPAYDGDPQAFVAALSQAGEAAELLDAHGLGGFVWLVLARDCPLPLRSGAGTRDTDA